QSVTVTQAGSGKTITATQGGASGTSDAFTVNAGALDNFAITPISSPQTAGTAFSIAITAQDANTNTVPSFTGTVTISSTGTLSAGSGTTASFAAGVLASHSVTISNTGNFTVTATGAAPTPTATSNAFTVNAGVLDHFKVEAAGGGNIATQTAGTAFSITITAQDANSNTVPSFGGTVDFSTTAGTITPVTSGTFSGGVRTESVAVTLAGAGKTITATRTGGSETGTSNAFTVNAGAVAKFAIGAISSPRTAGAAVNLALTAQDANTNTETGSGASVDLNTTA